MKKFTLFLFSLTLIMVIGLSGCKIDKDRYYKGLSIGFTHTGPRYSEIMYAIRSEKVDFNINDVTIDFYSGWFLDKPNTVNPEQEIHVVFYVKPEKVSMIIDPQEDYQDIENQYIILEEPATVFWSEAYQAEQTRLKGKKFTHAAENVKIPKEVFTEQEGSLEIYVQIVSYSEEDELYHFIFSYSLDYSIRFRYKYIDDDNIQLLDYV